MRRFEKFVGVQFLFETLLDVKSKACRLRYTIIRYLGTDCFFSFVKPDCVCTNYFPLFQVSVRGAILHLKNLVSVSSISHLCRAIGLTQR